MDIEKLISDIEDSIRKSELVIGQGNSATYPNSPIVVIYADEASYKMHDIVRNSLKSAWMIYDKKVVFAKLEEDTIEFLEGISGKMNNFDGLFEMEYNLNDFRYNICTVFSVVSSVSVDNEEDVYERIRTIDTYLGKVLKDRYQIPYLIALLDMENREVSRKIRSDFENDDIDCIKNKKLFIIENRNNLGANLTGVVSERKMFKNLSYIIRMSQLPSLSISDCSHLISSQEVYKPYYEMASGTVAGVMERINHYFNNRESELKNVSADLEDIAKEIGFKNGDFEYVNKNTEISAYVPTKDMLLLMPLAQPKEPMLDNAKVFNEETMGSFYAYVNSLSVNNDEIVTSEGYASYLKEKLSCFDMIKYFSDDSTIQGVIDYIKKRMIDNINENVSPFDYVKNSLKRQITNKLTDIILKDAISNSFRDAKSYIKCVTEIYGTKFSHRKEEIFNFYKTRTINNLKDSDLSTIEKICDPEQWLRSCISKIIKSDRMYSMSLEQELASRMNTDAVSASDAVVRELAMEDKYFELDYNYANNVDIANRIIFMDANSNLWNTIQKSITDVKIFDMPENNEINIMKIYTYRHD